MAKTLKTGQGGMYLGTLRMSGGSYVTQGKSQGLNMSISPKFEYGTQPEGKYRGKGFAPGFEDDESGSD